MIGVIIFMTKEDIIKYIEANYQLFTDVTFIGEYYKLATYNIESGYESVNNLYAILKELPDVTKQELIGYFKDSDYIQYLLAYSYTKSHYKLEFIYNIATNKITEDTDEIIQALYSELASKFNQTEIINITKKINNNMIKTELANNIIDLEAKTQVFNEIHSTVSEKDKRILQDIEQCETEEEKFILAKQIFTDIAKLDAIKLLSYETNIYTIAKTLTTDNALLEAIQYLSNEEYIFYIAEKINSNEYKFKIANNLKEEDFKYKLAKTITEDDYLIPLIDSLTRLDYIIELAINILKKDESIIKCLERCESVDTKLKLINALKKDEIRLQQLQQLHKNVDNYKQIFTVIINTKNPHNLYLYRDLIIDIFNQVDSASKLEIIELIIQVNNPIISNQCYEFLYDYLVEYFVKETDIPADKIKYVSSLFGNRIFEYLRNPQFKTLLISLNENEFYKLYQLFNYQEFNMSDVNGIYNSLIQQKFNVEYKEEREFFSTLLSNIGNQDYTNISIILEKISKTPNILQLFNNSRIKKIINENFEELIQIPQNENEFQYFLHQLINKIINEQNESKRDLLIVLLHDIAEINVNLLRDKYVNQSMSNEGINENLQLLCIPDKQKNINEFLKKDVFYIIETLSNISYRGLSEEIKDLLNHTSIIVECIKFRKNPQNFKSEIISKQELTKKYLHHFNLLLNIAYEQGLITNSLSENIVRYEVQPNIDYYDLLVEINPETLKNQILPNNDLYEAIKSTMHKLKLASWGDSFYSILQYLELEMNDETIGNLINKAHKIPFHKIEPTKPYDSIQTINIYTSASRIEKSIYGIDNYSFLAGNPAPNTSGWKKEERLIQSLNLYRRMFERNTITIPPINEVVSLKNNRNIRIVVGDTINPINMTLGERTGACMRIGGQADSLLNFCNTNPNGFHIRFEDPNTGKLISRVSGFRNGNTVFLNQLRFSLDSKYCTQDIIQACENAAEKIITLAQQQNDQIDNVIVSPGCAMADSGLPRILFFDIDDIKEGYSDFYSDIRNEGIILKTTNYNELVPIKLSGPKKEYPVSRQRPIVCQNSELASQQLNRLLSLESLLTQDSPQVIEVFENIPNAIVGEDWYIYTKENGEVISGVINGITEERKKRAVDELVKYYSNYNKYFESNKQNEYHK